MKTRTILALCFTFVVALALAACGRGTADPSPIPAGPAASCPTTITGSGNVAVCGQNNNVTVAPATPTPDKSATPTPKLCEITYTVMTGPEVLASNATATYELTPKHVDDQGRITDVPAECNLPRAPKIRWNVSGPNATISSTTACEPIPGDAAPIVCGFGAEVKRVANGQFAVTAIIEQRGVTRYVN